MATSYHVFVYIPFDHHAISFSDRHHKDLVEIVPKPHNLCVIFTTAAQKLQDAFVMSLQVPYDYFKSLRSFLGPN